MTAKCSPAWRGYLAGQPCDDFERFWNMELEPLDVANQSRKGWSQAFKLSLRTPAGDTRRFVVKRQQDYNRFSFTDPLRGHSLGREYFNICRYRRLGIPTIEPMYFGRSKTRRADRNILITGYLEHYQSLEDLTRRWRQEGPPPVKLRRRLIEAVARQVRKLHQARLVHRHLQLKHIYVRLDDDQVDVRFIDLESSRRHPLGFGIGLRDLVTMNRSAREVPATDRLRFILAYLGVNRLDRRSRRLCRKIIKATIKKHAK